MNNIKICSNENTYDLHSYHMHFLQIKNTVMNEIDEHSVIQLLYIPFLIKAAGKMNVSNEGYQCAPRASLLLKVINKLQMTKDIVLLFRKIPNGFFKSA